MLKHVSPIVRVCFYFFALLLLLNPLIIIIICNKSMEFFYATIYVTQTHINYEMIILCGSESRNDKKIF